MKRAAMTFGMLACGLVALGGCTLPSSEKVQSLTIKTMAKGEYIAGATCVLRNVKGTWKVTTPAIVDVARSTGDLNVLCWHDGYIANAGGAPASMHTLVRGNVLYAPLTSDQFDYPNPITVELHPIHPVTASR